MEKKQLIVIGILIVFLASFSAMAYSARIGVFNPKSAAAYGLALPSYAPEDEAGIRHTLSETELDTLRVTLHIPETDSIPINESLRNAAQARADAFMAQNYEGFFEARYETHRYNSYLVSFLLDYYAFTPKTGLVHTREAMTVDLMGGREVHLSDMFTPGFDYIAVSADAVRAQLAETLSAKAGNDDAREQLLASASAMSAPLAGNYRCFVFDTSQITFFFQTEESDLLSAAIPLSDFGNDWCADLYAMQYFGTRDGDTVAANDSPLPEITPTPTPTTAPGYLDGKQGPFLAITFDDGPTRQCTERLLNGLAELNAHATFFVVGHRLGGTSDLITRMINEGHSIGSHTYNHADLTAVTQSTVAYQLDSTNELIRNITGQDTVLLRPPYGARDARLAQMAAERNMSLIIWSVDPQDWKTRDATTLSNHIIARAKDGDIILLHDLYETSVDAALIAIKELQAQGYTFVTVDELLELNGGRAVGGIYRNGKATVAK